MIKRILLFLFIGIPLYADDYVLVNTDTNSVIPVQKNSNTFKANILTTSSDWESVTGLNLSEYKITFINTKPAGTIGYEIYYLDGFPCYGQSQYVRTWVNQNDKSGFIRINCIKQPKTISFAYRVAHKDDVQDTTTGLLTCPVSKDLNVDLSDCDTKTWKDYARD